MAGHSQFKNIMYRKGTQDQKRGKLFTKATREIMVAVKEGGPELESNARLRAAVISARAVNMPRDNIERTIKKAAGGNDGVNYSELRYEGYGPGGTAVIVEALTDNRNRTASDVRSLFTRFGGNLGENGSVAFQFEHVGIIEYSQSVTDFDTIFDQALNQGALDISMTSSSYSIITPFEKLNTIRETLAELYGQALHSQAVWQPINTIEINEQQGQNIIKLIEALEDLDDVQSVHSNFEIDSEILQKLSQS